MKVIGITGSIASGKSTALEYISSLGGQTLQIDKVSFDVVKNNEECHKRVCDFLGKEYFSDKTINKQITERLYKERKMNLLNDITMPFVIKELEKQFTELKKRNKNIYVEGNTWWFDFFKSHADLMVAVIPYSLDIQIHHLMNRNKITHEQAMYRIFTQLEDERLYHDAVYSIINNYDGNMIEDVKKIYFEIEN